MQLRFLVLTSSLFLAFCVAPAYAADTTSRTGQTKESTSAEVRAFLTQAAGAGAYEVEVSKMAAEKATQPDVRKYAQMLVQHHTAVNDELKTLASLKALALAADLSPDLKAKYVSLQNMAGQTFDIAYLQNVGIDDHEKDIKLFERAARSADDAEVRAFATKTLPTLNRHLSTAKELTKQRKSERSSLR